MDEQRQQQIQVYIPTKAQKELPYSFGAAQEGNVLCSFCNFKYERYCLETGSSARTAPGCFTTVHGLPCTMQIPQFIRAHLRTNRRDGSSIAVHVRGIPVYEFPACPPCCKCSVCIDRVKEIEQRASPLRKNIKLDEDDDFDHGGDEMSVGGSDDDFWQPAPVLSPVTEENYVRLVSGVYYDPHRAF